MSLKSFFSNLFGKTKPAESSPKPAQPSPDAVQIKQEETVSSSKKSPVGPSGHPGSTKQSFFGATPRESRFTCYSLSPDGRGYIVSFSEEADASERIDCLLIPDTHEGLPVIGAREFHDIGMKEILLPDSLETVESFAFGALKMLERIEIPPKVKILSRSLFAYDEKLASVILPEGLTDIEDDCFDDCRYLRSLGLPSTLKNFGSGNIFYNDENCSTHARSIAFPNGSSLLQKKDRYLFNGDGTILLHNLERLVDGAVLPEGVKKIGPKALEDYYPTKIVLPQSLAKIDELAFGGLPSLRFLEIPDFVSEIGPNAFGEAGELKNLTLAPRNQNFVMENGILFSKDKTRLLFANRTVAGDYTVPPTVLHIDKNAFYGCGKLSGIIMNEGVADVGDNAFGGYRIMRLKYVIMPKSVKSFSSSQVPQNIKTIYFLGSPEDRAKMVPWNHDKNWEKKIAFYSAQGPEDGIHQWWSYGPEGKPVLWGDNAPVSSEQAKTKEIHGNPENTSKPLDRSINETAASKKVDSSGFSGAPISHPKGTKNDAQISQPSETLNPNDGLPKRIGLPADDDRADATEIGPDDSYNAESKGIHDKHGVVSAVEEQPEKEKSGVAIADEAPAAIRGEAKEGMVHLRFFADETKKNIIDEAYVPLGSIPTFEGKLPFDPQPDEKSFMAFTGWAPSLDAPVQEDTDFVAEHKRLLYREIYEYCEQGCDVFSSDPSHPTKWAKGLGIKVKGGVQLVTAFVPPALPVGDIKFVTYYGFWGQKKLLQVQLPKTLIAIDTNAFEGCSALKELVIPEGITDIKDEAFSSLTVLRKISLPASLRNFDEPKNFKFCPSIATFVVNPASPVYLSDGRALYRKKDKALVRVGAGNKEPYAIREGTLFIEEDAFSGCEMPVILPRSLRSIHAGAFQRYLGPSAVLKIPANVQNMHEGFYNNALDPKPLICPFVDLLVDPANPSFKSVDGIVYSKDGLTLAVVPSKHGIPGGVVQVPTGVQKIDRYALAGNEGIKHIKLPESLLSIGREAFSYLDSLESVVVPKSVVSIEGNIFSSTGLLKHVFYEGKEKQWDKLVKRSADPIAWSSVAFYSEQAPTVDSVETYWHYGPDGEPVVWQEGEYVQPAPRPLDSANPAVIEENKAVIEKNTAEEVLPASDSEFGFKRAQGGKGFNLTGYFGKESVVKAPAMHEGLPVRGVSHFKSRCQQSYELILPEGLKKLEDQAFFHDKKVTKLYLPDSLEGIGEFAFDGSRIEEIRIPDKCKTLFSCIIQSLPHLKKVTGGSQVEDLRGFIDCPKLEELPPFPHLKNIADFAFSGTENLKEFTIPEGVTSIGENAFLCSGLRRIHFPATLWRMGNDVCAFCPLESITLAPGNPFYSLRGGCLYTNEGTDLVIAPRCGERTFVVPEGTTEIAQSAFTNSLYEEVKLPNGIDIVRNNCFANSPGLKTISFPRSTKTVSQHSFLNDTALEAVFFEEPSQVKAISFETFSGCEHLLWFVFPSSVQKISRNAFANCLRLTIVILPPSLKIIDGEAFLNCPNLHYLFYPGPKVDFDRVKIVGGGAYVLKGITCYYSEEKPTDTKLRYWHYKSDESTPELWK